MREESIAYRNAQDQVTIQVKYTKYKNYCYALLSLRL